jgi:hypothetical protein
MRKLKETLSRAKNDFPEEFKNMISCRESPQHEWFIVKQNVRLVDVECSKCKTNLAIALKLFTGVQDHG